MDMNKFTFGLLMYNQQSLVVETLESIKYQIITYGKGFSFKLIVIDDASTDASVLYINKWLEDNPNLFDEKKIVVNTYNHGTVYNYNALLKMIDREPFKILACDDLISSGNLLEKYKKLNDNDLVCFQRLELIDGKIDVNLKLLQLHFSDIHYSNKDKAKRMRRGWFIHSPSVLYTKSLYKKSKANRLNSKFKLLEDDPTWYSMIKKGANVIFANDVIVLYRMHGKSVSNSEDQGGKNEAFENDLRKLYTLYYKESNGLERLFFKFRLKMNIPKYLHIDKMLLRIMKMVYACHRLLHYKEYCYMVEKLRDVANIEQAYYDTIREKSDMFYAKMRV